MDVRRFDISEVCLLALRQIHDDRGCFAELYHHRLYRDVLGLDGPFVQDNLSRTKRAGTVRALHFQKPPNAQGKLVRVVRGAIRDVAVDLRKNSPTYGRHVTIDLHEDRLELFWIPPGFAHGFVTAAPNTEVNFKVTAYYSKEDEVGILWSDPDLAIDWGVTVDSVIVSERDRRQPRFSALESPF